jgi:hypothetical protein
MFAGAMLPLVCAVNAEAVLVLFEVSAVSVVVGVTVTDEANVNVTKRNMSVKNTASLQARKQLPLLSGGERVLWILKAGRNLPQSE